MMPLMSQALALGFPQPANVPGVQMTRWNLDGVVLAAGFSGDGSHAAFGLDDGSVRLVPLQRFAARMMTETTLHHRRVTAIRPDCTADQFLCLGEDNRVVYVNGSGFGAELADLGQGPGLHVDAHPAVGRAIAHGCQVDLYDHLGVLRQRIAGDREAADLAFSPDGRRLAVAHDGRISLWSDLHGTPQSVELTTGGPTRSLAWSADSRRIAGCVGRIVQCWRLADGTRVLFDGGARTPRELSWTGETRYLAGACSDAILCWPMQRNGRHAAWPRALGVMADAPVTRIACHPRHPLVAAGYDDGCVLLADVRGGREIVARHADGDAIEALSWSSNGDFLAVGSDGGLAAILDFTSLTRRTPK